MKNVLGQAGQIAGKTKNVESVTGLFKGITGKQDVKNVLSGVAVSIDYVTDSNSFLSFIVLFLVEAFASFHLFVSGRYPNGGEKFISKTVCRFRACA